MLPKKRFVLIDGYSFLFRAFYSLPPLVNKNNIPIGAVYGFINMFLKIVSNTKLRPDFLAVALDSGKETFRNKIYPQYKQNRKDPPEDLVPQFSILRQAVQSSGASLLELEGFEADDIIAHYAKSYSSNETQVVVVSPDKDLLQLVKDDFIVVFDPMKDKFLDEQAVQEKMSVRADQVADFLALTGDASDNIKGVPGIGPKTAADLLKQYDTLDRIFSHLHNISGKKAQNLESGKESALLSKKLVNLHEVSLNGTAAQLPPISDCIANLNFSENKEFKDFLKQNGFDSILNKIEQRADNALNATIAKGIAGATSSLASQPIVKSHKEPSETLLRNQDSKTTQEIQDQLSSSTSCFIYNTQSDQFVTCNGKTWKITKTQTELF